MEMALLYEEFLSYLDLERGCSPLTIKSYRSDFRLFRRYLKQANIAADVSNTDRQTIRRYITWMRSDDLKSSSIARRLNSLRSFWNYLRDSGYTQMDPFLRISVPKGSKPVPHYLSADECEELLAATERQSSIARAFRDRAILSVLIFTGIRRAELLDLRLDSVDLSQGTLRVENGKGRKTRVVPLCERAAAALRDWLEFRQRCDHDYLFTSIARRRLGVKGLMGVLYRALAKTNIDSDSVTLHTLRHSFACLMLQGGCDLFALSRLLGHTRLDTTAIYLHVSIEDLRESLAAHPLNGQ